MWIEEGFCSSVVRQNFVAAQRQRIDSGMWCNEKAIQRMQLKRTANFERGCVKQTRRRRTRKITLPSIDKDT